MKSLSKKEKKRVGGQEQKAIEEQTENKENVWREIQADEKCFSCALPFTTNVDVSGFVGCVLCFS